MTPGRRLTKEAPLPKLSGRPRRRELLLWAALTTALVVALIAVAPELGPAGFVALLVVAALHVLLLLQVLVTGRRPASTPTRSRRPRAAQPLAGRLDRVERRVDRVERRIQKALTARAREEFAQVEALLGLHALVRPSAALPPSRGWAAAPTTLLTLTDWVRRLRPELVVECGSGLSSICVGSVLKQLGHGRCVSLEHEEEFAAKTRADLERHGLSDVVEVRVAPLVDVDVDGGTQPWYDPQAVADLRDIGVVFVDGPPGTVAPHARLPVVEMLRDRCRPGAVLVLDDAARGEEREIIEKWTELGLTELASSGQEKGWAVLRVDGR
jgi:predicted O-methyltransferase YrrM